MEKNRQSLLGPLLQLAVSYVLSVKNVETREEENEEDFPCEHVVCLWTEKVNEEGKEEISLWERNKRVVRGK